MLKKAIVVILLSGLTCALHSEPVGKTKQDVAKASEPIIENILAAMESGDVLKFRMDFDDTMKDAFPENKADSTIESINAQIGNCVSREYLGFLNAQGMTKVLWKGKYDKTEEDVLITLVISKRKNKNLVSGLWFQ